MNIELLEEVTTELTVPERASLALGSVKARTELTALVAKSADIKEIKNNAGRQECHSAAMALVKARTTIAATGKAARDDATKFSKAVISEEAVLTAITTPEEKRLLALRDAWDEKVAAEKALLEKMEAEQAARIQARIDCLGFDMELLGASPVRILQDISELSSIEVNLEIFGSRAGEAAQLQANTLMQLEKLHASAVATEAQKAALELQQAELAAAQKKLDDDQAAAVAARMAEYLRLAGLRAEEERRIAVIHDRLAVIRGYFVTGTQLLIGDLSLSLKNLESCDLGGFDEFEAEAKTLHAEAISHLHAVITRAQEIANEYARIKVEQEASAAERQKADDLAAAARKLQAELDAIERAEFERSVAEKRAEEARIAASETKIRNAAPALLLALQKMVHKARKQNWNDNYPDELKQAEEAINQATGE